LQDKVKDKYKDKDKDKDKDNDDSLVMIVFIQNMELCPKGSDGVQMKGMST
jgi:hypothetical protein